MDMRCSGFVAPLCYGPVILLSVLDHHMSTAWQRSPQLRCMPRPSPGNLPCLGHHTESQGLGGGEGEATRKYMYFFHYLRRSGHLGTFLPLYTCYDHRKTPWFGGPQQPSASFSHLSGLRSIPLLPLTLSIGRGGREDTTTIALALAPNIDRCGLHPTPPCLPPTIGQLVYPINGMIVNQLLEPSASAMMVTLEEWSPRASWDL